MTLFYRLACFALRIPFRLFYHHKVILPKELLLSKAAIIAPNHLSFLDPPLIAISWPEAIFFFAKAALFKNPLLKTIISNLNATPVGSGNDLTSMKLACRLLEEGKKIVIFPEGTRSKDGSVLPLKKGVATIALRTNCPIIPAYIHGTFDIWPKNKKMPYIFGKKTACLFGEAIFPSEFAHLDPKDACEKLTSRLQEEILKLQQVYTQIN